MIMSLAPRRLRDLSREVRNVWRESPPWLKRGTKWSVGFGALLFVLGATADALNLRASEWGYFVNIYSSVTAFFIAVPVALIGLDAVNETRREAADKKAVNNLTKRAWDRFARAAAEYCIPGVIEMLPKTPVEVFRVYSTLRRTIREYVSTQPGAGRNPSGYAELRNEIEQARDTIKSGLDDMIYALPLGRDIQLRWSFMRSRWRVLDAEIQIRRDELGLDWISDSTYRVFEDRLSDDTHPLASFYSSCHRSKNIPSLLVRMGDAPYLLDSLLAMDEQEFLRVVGSSTLDPFRHDEDGAEQFLMDALNAKLHLEEIVAAVARVDIESLTE